MTTKFSTKSFKKQNVEVGYKEQPWDDRRGLVAYWNDDGKTAATWKDMVNYPNGKNDGTIYGAGTPPSATPGTLGYLFDGVDDYVDAGNDASLNITEEITIVAWVIPDNNIADNFLISKPKGSDPWYYYCLLVSFGKIKSIINIGGVEYGQLANDSYVIGEIYHIAVTYDGANIKLYINSILQSDHDSVTGAISEDITQKVYIGSWDGTQKYFNGVIDEIRIYNRALVASEVSLLFQKYRGKFGV